MEEMDGTGREDCTPSSIQAHGISVPFSLTGMCHEKYRICNTNVKKKKSHSKVAVEGEFSGILLKSVMYLPRLAKQICVSFLRANLTMNYYLAIK